MRKKPSPAWLATAEKTSGWFMLSHSAPIPPDERPTTARCAALASVQAWVTDKLQ